MKNASIMGEAQELWLESSIASQSKEAGIQWQLLGQQLLMGKLNVPHFEDHEFAMEQQQSISNGSYGLLRKPIAARASL